MGRIDASITIDSTAETALLELDPRPSSYLMPPLRPSLRPVLSPKLAAAGFRHGFFGRVGGQSEGCYASLNCSYSVGDTPEHVTANLSHIARHLGVAPEHLMSTSQVHGCAVVDVDELRQRSDPSCPLPGDAIVSRSSPWAACIRTADCIPVLVGCRATGAVAAIHAGWRGLVAEVIPRAVERLVTNGARTNALVAAIGPHIGASAFEVSDEVASALESVAPSANAIVRASPGRPHVRLGAIALAQLLRQGLELDQVDALDCCTFSGEQAFFSYRRDGKSSGRQLSAVLPLQ